MRNRSFPLSLLALILFIAVINGLANEFSWYWRIQWLDMPMHFLGGLWVGSAALWVFGQTAYLRPYRVLGISLLTVLVLGIAWELFEFSLDTLIVVSEQNGMLDTAVDIIFDIIGGTVAAAYFIFKNNE